MRCPYPGIRPLVYTQARRINFPWVTKSYIPSFPGSQILALPKSVILIRMSSSSRTFSGFRSRWMTPRACIQATVSIICAVYQRAHRRFMDPNRDMRVCNSPLGTRSRTKSRSHYKLSQGFNNCEQLTEAPLVLECPVQSHYTRVGRYPQLGQNILLNIRGLDHLFSHKVILVDDLNGIRFSTGRISGRHDLYIRRSKHRAPQKLTSQTVEYDPSPSTSPNWKSSGPKRPTAELLRDLLADAAVSASWASAVFSVSNSLER